MFICFAWHGLIFYHGLAKYPIYFLTGGVQKQLPTIYGYISQIKTLMHVLLKGFSKDLSPYYLDKFICVLEKRTAAAYVQIMIA